jgi:hypothetical protein
MKKLILAAAGIYFLLTAIALKATAQVTFTGQITAEVIEAIIATESSPMTLNFSLTDNSINPASFSVSGVKDAAFAITLPAGPTTLTSNSGDTITVSGWTAASGHENDALILSDGIQTVKVGAILQDGVINDIPKGVYAGSYQITFAYN